MDHLITYCEIALSANVIARALKVSLVVGTALNLINQGESLIAVDFANLHFVKLGLTYLVPYGVTTYTSTAIKVEFQIGTKAILSADLTCKKCGCEIHVSENEVIPECQMCGVSTHWRLK